LPREESGSERPAGWRGVSPEARRNAAIAAITADLKRAEGKGSEANGPDAGRPDAERPDASRVVADFNRRFQFELVPGGRTLVVLRRVWVGVWHDGFIHAGNLAYMTILALFPFFIVVAAILSALGETREQAASLHAVLSAVPRIVAQVIEPVARDVMDARTGWLLWVGCLVALWTVSSLMETIRDILKRAYGAPPASSFLRHRLLSTGIVIAAAILLLLSLFAQVAITAAQEIIAAWFPRLNGWLVTLTSSRIIPGAVLYGSIFALFASLTPGQYRGSAYPKWPGALLVTGWWMLVTAGLPMAVRHLMTYNLTYGSLAGVMIALFFFWLVGLGIVVGAELNAALTETPEERNALGQANDRARMRQIQEQGGAA
jgi:membrane protein